MLRSARRQTADFCSGSSASKHLRSAARAYEILLMWTSSYFWSSSLANCVSPSEYSPSAWVHRPVILCAAEVLSPTDYLPLSQIESGFHHLLPSSCSESASGSSSESSRPHSRFSAQEPSRGVGLKVRGAAGDDRVSRGNNRRSQSQARINTLSQIFRH